MDWTKKLLLALGLAVGCSSLIAFHSRAAYAPSEGQVSGQAEAASDPQLDLRLAKYYEIYASVLSFEERIAQAETANGGRKPKQIEIVKGQEEGLPHGLPASVVRAGESQLLQRQAANADVIIMGRPLSERSLPIEDRTFLFTEYTVRVDRVISCDRHNVATGDVITVSRGGGELVVDNVLVKAVEPAFQKFQQNRDYIFMLHSVSGTDTYRALGSGTFLVENGKIGTISPAEAAREPKRDLDSFLVELNEAVARKRPVRN